MISETKEAPQSERPVGGFENNRRGRETEVPQPALRFSECFQLVYLTNQSISSTLPATNAPTPTSAPSRIQAGATSATLPIPSAAIAAIS